MKIKNLLSAEQGVDFNKKQALNLQLQNLTSDPSSPVLGQKYFNTTTNKERVWNGTTWDESGTSSGDVTQASASTGAGKIKISAGATKQIVDYGGADGILKSVGGAATPAIADTDYATPAGILSKVLTGLPAGTNTPITSAMTLLTALANIQAEISATMASIASVAKPMGGIDCSTSPNYPAGTIGDFYRVTVAGKIGGGSGLTVEIGDELHCYITGVAGTQASVGANWTLVQANVGQANNSTLGLLRTSTSTEVSTGIDPNVAVTPYSLFGSNYLRGTILTIGNGSSTVFTITSASIGANSMLFVSLILVSGSEIIYPDITNSGATITITFVTAPTSNQYGVYIAYY